MATILGKVMITLGGDYDSAKTYDPLTGVTHNGSFYISKQTVQGVEPGTNDNYWQLSAQGYPGAASGVSIVDSQGMVVTAGQTTDLQALENAIADRVMNKLLAKTDLITQYINDTTKPAAASLAYDLNSQLTTLNGNMATTNTQVATLETGLVAVHRTGTNQTVNLNSLESGFVYCNNDSQNLPDSAYGFCLTFYRDANTRFQLFASLTNKVYFRTRSTGVWQAWVTL